jgi:hypothetical protein
MKTRKIKPRNLVARAVRDPQGMFRPKAERDRTKYNRKEKHKKVVDKCPS